MLSKIEVNNILVKIGFYSTFQNILNHKFPEIDYGKRIGKIRFESFFDANNKYKFNGEDKTEEYHNWNIILNDFNSSEEDILVVCLKIFDWGKVLEGNVKSAIDLYEKNKLKNYIATIKNLLNSKDMIKIEECLNQPIYWTSGWTKVYSFLNPDILIYDSRVSAFLNFLLIKNYPSFNQDQKEKFNKLSGYLFNFSGAVNRDRKVSKSFGFKNRHPKGIEGFNANLIASWIIQLCKEKFKLEEEIRSFERAFFMLGFDLSQIK